MKTERDDALQLFAAAVAKAAQSLRAARSVILLHHNDADGLTSGAILAAAFERENKRIIRYTLEKPYPQALEAIWAGHSGESAAVVIADFGSGMLPIISSINRQRMPVLVLDHHLIAPVEDPFITVINPLSFGISGRTDCSAGTVCFYFACALNSWNEDLAAIGMLGAMGDGQQGAAGEWSGPNVHPAECAERLGLARSRSSEVKGQEGWIASARIVDALNALGSIGYLRGGPDVGVKALRDGFGTAAFASAEGFQTEYDKLRNQFLAVRRWIDTDPLVSFTLGDEFKQCGVKTVGLLAEVLRDGPLRNVERYIIGFQPVPPRIPGLGSIEFNETKVSMRISPPMWTRVEAGERPTLVDVLPKAALGLDGFVDACHPHAAAVTVPSGQEDALLSAVAQELGI